MKRFSLAAQTVAVYLGDQFPSLLIALPDAFYRQSQKAEDAAWERILSLARKDEKEIQKLVECAMAVNHGRAS